MRLVRKWFGPLITVAVLAAVGLVVLSAEPVREGCLDSDVKEQARQIMQSAVDEALRQQVQNLFMTWMKDNTGQPSRAATGIHRATAAYQHSQRVLEGWNPPECGK